MLSARLPLQDIDPSLRSMIPSAPRTVNFQSVAAPLPRVMVVSFASLVDEYHLMIYQRIKPGCVRVSAERAGRITLTDPKASCDAGGLGIGTSRNAALERSARAEKRMRHVQRL